MSFEVINPATGEKVTEIPSWDSQQLETALAAVANASPLWRKTAMSERCTLMHKAADVLRKNKDIYAAIVTQEMGKLINDARAEVEKCATVCDFYADNGPQFLADEAIESDAGKSYVGYFPLGTVLAVMPWNFPLWQVFRFAAPALVAGNTGVLKHASNVPQCALLIEDVFKEAGFPQDVFRSLMIRASQVKAVIEDERVHAVTLTGANQQAGKLLRQRVAA